ncbi:hypothetical protein DERP_002658 [Dermatophagoides pteronyssinus]|uniref:Uncharacterized protein n=1 Tax=Dermatophagoides pteronyssinus TaxID=6956 RepID=A0ABQ8JVA1_DERPT|nr:hypothetical protein DERP_002658 [Dermatophagoides pteronyssinus]
MDSIIIGIIYESNPAEAVVHYHIRLHCFIEDIPLLTYQQAPQFNLNPKYGIGHHRKPTRTIYLQNDSLIVSKKMNFLVSLEIQLNIIITILTKSNQIYDDF